MAVSTLDTGPLPWWPDTAPDPTRVDIDYDPPSDELTIFFGGEPVPAICDPVEALGGDIAVMYDGTTGEVVGVQVIPLLLGAINDRPAWGAIAWAAMAGEFGTELLRERLPGLLAEVAAALVQEVAPQPSGDAPLASRVPHSVGPDQRHD